MRTEKIEGVEVLWDWSCGEIPWVTADRIRDAIKAFEELGIEIVKWYMGRDEYLIVRQIGSSREVRIHAEDSKVDGSWIRVSNEER